MIYGSVAYRSQTPRGLWLINCEPHVRSRLKRVFPRMPQQAAHTLLLSDTPENSRELEWFLLRYPMELSPEDRERLAGRSQAHVEAEQSIGQLLDGRLPLDEIRLALPPRDYQRYAAQMLELRRGLLLADDVGLGKTVTAICSMAREENLPALVVCPTHMPSHWAHFIQRFLPDLQVHVLKKGTPYELVRKSGPLFPARYPDVLVTNYHKLKGWAETLAGQVKLVVFDECQQLRNGGSEIYHACELVSHAARCRLGLSATPIYNYGSEFWHVVNALLPDALGDRGEFLREWCVGYSQDKAKIKKPEEFGAYLRREGIMLRRTRKDVGRELPQLTKVVHTVDADPEALNTLTGDAVTLAQTILAQNEAFRGERMNAAGQFDALVRQATGLAKAPYVAEFVRMLLEGGEEKVVLFGWHREVYSLWMQRLKEYNPRLYTGSETPAQKDAAVQAFVSGESRLLIMSLRSGAGVDGLQHCCSTMVFGELDWSPGVHEQCLDAETQILTQRGFVGPDELQDSDLVAGFDRETEAISWQPILSRVDRPLAPGERMFGLQSPTVDLRVTGGHRMVYRRAHGRKQQSWGPWLIKEASELSKATQSYRIPVAGIQAAQGVPLSDNEIRLIGWYLTDGSFNRVSRQLTICQSEASPFNDAIRSCLDGCGMHYTIDRTEAGTGSQFNRRSALLRYNVPKLGPKNSVENGGQVRDQGWARLEPYLDKSFSPLLEDLDARQLELLLEAINQGDGWKYQPSGYQNLTYHIGTGNKEFAERLQSLCVRRGWRANLSERYPLPGSKLHYTLHLRKQSFRAVGGAARNDRASLAEVPHTSGERVWCVENALGTLVIRRNGKVAVVGNCQGRLDRDGQQRPVVAYYLTAEEGCDPVMVHVLGIKREQIEGVRNPGQDLLVRLDKAGDHIRELARRFLTERSVPLPEEVDPEPVAALALPEPLTRPEPVPHPRMFELAELEALC